MSTTADYPLEKEMIEGLPYFKISHIDSMRPFLMTLVSPSNHWMYISSNGGLSAGRKDADGSIFPYYTDDKITESAEITGSKTIFRIKRENKVQLWEPFSLRHDARSDIKRNLYKSTFGTDILFEEINYDLGLTFKYRWSTSSRYGFVKKSYLTNNSSRAQEVSVLDGLQNLLPSGVPSLLQQNASNLVDAYKRSELVLTVGLGIYTLSALIVDRAEPSEALKATVVWSSGLDGHSYLLSSLQLDHFRQGIPLHQELDIKAEKGAYFICADLNLAPTQVHEWTTVADVNKNHTDVIEVINRLAQDHDLTKEVENDVEEGRKALIRMVGAADGLQLSSDQLGNARHFSNCLFNIMRGGIFDDNYAIKKSDFVNYLQGANKILFDRYRANLCTLPKKCTLAEIRELSASISDPDLTRLTIEYLPLWFSRRHGDPSRPWNKFSINTQRESDHSRILDYEGNWRDIFQNWEALAYSYPEFIDGMIHKFLNASTRDGYNPYRIAKGGIDWEIIDPEDPWSYIGYWGDHQIIYLLKLLEHMDAHHPNLLVGYFDQEVFVFVDVPYRIKAYEANLADPKNTVTFDHAADSALRHQMQELGADGALQTYVDGSIVHVNLLEKILVTVLTKVSNFIPEAGIWMNTQRPEWNDANNALVGNGVSVVTLCYLKRFLLFLQTLIQSKRTHVSISIALDEFLRAIHETLASYQHELSGSITDRSRKAIMDGLGRAASHYRSSVYEQPMSEKQEQISMDRLDEFIELTLLYASHTIDSNKRSDGLYHAYNIITVAEEEVKIGRLDEMLEGQVAVLSSGHLTADESLAVLDALKASELYRRDQKSYLLYPNKSLPGFLDKNIIPTELMKSSALLRALIKEGDTTIVEQDVNGAYHFNSNFKNVADLEVALNALSASEYQGLLEEEHRNVLDIYEVVFNHKAFTGRSGTFFGYEGLGSIYWHMVSKLQLAVQEACFWADKNASPPSTLLRLIDHYYEIKAGIGVHKPPALYGAFPTDPYSHTPGGKGAQQPGMTGQVKEDILSRFGELGIQVSNGSLHFRPSILRQSELLKIPSTFDYVDVKSQLKHVHLRANSLVFTYCQIPIIYSMGERECLSIHFTDATTIHSDGLSIDPDTSQRIFRRTGMIAQIEVELTATNLLN